MKLATIVISLLVAFAAHGAAAQDDRKPATGAAVQGTGQGQAGVTASPGGATASGDAAAAAGAEAGSSTANIAQGTEINATLTRPVDAGKARPGDEVTATAAKDVRSGGAVIVPRGARLIGRVTQARPRGSDSAGGGATSELGIVFDRAVLKDGSSIALNGAVAAVGTARAAGVAGGSPLDAGGAGARPGSGGGLAGAVGGTVGGVASATTGAAGQVGATVGGAASAGARSAGAIGGIDAAGSLKSGSRGVFGMRDLDIATAATGDAEGSVITSARRTVRLESGAQLLLVASGSAGGKPAPDADVPAEKPQDKR